MKQFSIFVFGVTLGMYVAQNYNAPNVKDNYILMVKTIKNYEK
jgi:hypothetical protein